jgi:hypothetical protein
VIIVVIVACLVRKQAELVAAVSKRAESWYRAGIADASILAF